MSKPSEGCHKSYVRGVPFPDHVHHFTERCPAASVDASAIPDGGGTRWEGWRTVADACRAVPMGRLSVTDGWQRLCRGELLFAQSRIASNP